MAACDMEKQQHQQEQDLFSSPAQPSPIQKGFMQKFRLYQTLSKFYMIGRDKSRTYWRVLKIDRTEPSELHIREDSTTYTERECTDLLRRIHEGNRSTGGLKFVTTCYGIVGFIKFLGPYYMLLITKRRQIGAICGHTVYAITKSEMIPLPNAATRSKIVNFRSENRYRKLLCMVDLTKDFFFSYSYHVMRSLQKNMCDYDTGPDLYDSMFVWNEYMTRGTRNLLQNTIWTVALVYGFFKQESLSLSGRDFKLTLIARRSRHYAGTRYLKRGVNENGKVANDVETEQILFEDVPEDFPVQISSVVQNRGSIPLFWFQETSRLNLKPDIILSKRDQTYEATRLHFENLAERYGNPIIILDLIKTQEKSLGSLSFALNLLMQLSSSTRIYLKFLFCCFVVYRIRKARILSRPQEPVEEEEEEFGDIVDEDIHGPMVDHPIWYIRTVGLQPSIISAITICKYKTEEGIIEGTDCSVCLSEFQEDETLRILPNCNHAFHIPCIDTWLRSHTNCPMCRAGIVIAPAADPSLPEQNSGPRHEEEAHSGISENGTELSLDMENEGESLELHSMDISGNSKEDVGNGTNEGVLLSEFSASRRSTSFESLSTASTLTCTSVSQSCEMSARMKSLCLDRAMQEHQMIRRSQSAVLLR